MPTAESIMLFYRKAFPQYLFSVCGLFSLILSDNNGISCPVEIGRVTKLCTKGWFFVYAAPFYHCHHRKNNFLFSSL